jgi:predicted RNA-binding Zn ribbon-like protein
MSKRQQAPGGLEHVRSFVNTLDMGDGRDQLAEPAALAAWLSERGLVENGARAGAADLRRAIELREALRAVLLAHNGGVAAPAPASETLDDAVRRARVQLRFDADGAAVLAPQSAGVDGALGRLLVFVQASIAGGTWPRLKACREHTCEWAFYDSTKNRSGAWCTMEVCGNRAKARAYRERVRNDP